MKSQHLRATLTRLSAFLFLAAIAVSCEPASDSRCGNENELWIHAVVVDPECADCVEFSFETPIINASEFRVRREPDVVLARCEIVKVRAHADAATLVLSDDGRRKILDAIETPGGALQNVRLVALRLAKSAELTSVMYVEDMGQYMMIFDLDSKPAVDRFIRDLAVPSSATDSAPMRALHAQDAESAAAREAQGLLDELAEEDAALQSLEERVRAGEGEKAIEEFLRRRREAKE